MSRGMRHHIQAAYPFLSARIRKVDLAIFAGFVADTGGQMGRRRYGRKHAPIVGVVAPVMSF